MTDDLDRQLDDRLRAAFGPPASAAFERQAARVVGRPRAASLPTWLVAAAAVLVVAILWVGAPRRRGPEGHDGRQLGTMWAAAYEDAQARGFGGAGCCETGFELSTACEASFAVRIELAQQNGVALLGGYCGLPTGGCMALLASAEGTPVGIYIVRAEQDPYVVLPPECPLRLARRELDGLVLYGLSQSTLLAATTIGEFVIAEQ